MFIALFLCHVAITDLMNVRLNGTIFCFCLVYYLYAEIDCCAYVAQWLGLG